MDVHLHEGFSQQVAAEAEGEADAGLMQGLIRLHGYPRRRLACSQEREGLNGPAQGRQRLHHLEVAARACCRCRREHPVRKDQATAQPGDQDVGALQG